MKIIPFKYMDKKEVKVIDQNGEPWFVAGDVMGILGLTNITEIMRRLDSDEQTSVKLKSGNRTIKMHAVNEPGLYNLILRSRKPEAKDFKRWVTHEVLPTIRETGIYHTPDVNPDFLRHLADKLETETKRADEAVRTKAHISDRKTATAMATASTEKRKRKALEKKYIDSDYLTVSSMNWIKQLFKKYGKTSPTSLIGFDLVKISKELGKKVEKVKDTRYGAVNSYHKEVSSEFKKRVKRGEVREPLKKHLRKQSA